MNFRFFYRVIVPIGLVALAAGFPLAGLASEKKEARVTQVVQDVQLLSTGGAAHRALVNESVHEGMTVRTGSDSRVELRFLDGKIIRLGANATLSFANEGRTLNLEEGAAFLVTPDGAKATKISSGGIAAALGGTTVVFEFHSTHYKFLVLEGTGRLFRPEHLGDSVLVEAGQMVFGQPNAALSDPVDFDIGRFVKTSRFITGFSPLGGLALMAVGSETQQREKSKKKLIETNMVILGGGTAVSLVDPVQLQAIDHPTPEAKTSVRSSPDLGKVETLSRTARKPTPNSSKTGNSE
jgi:hypothetical protein